MVFQFFAAGLDSPFDRALVSGLGATLCSEVCSKLSSVALGLLNWIEAASESGLAEELWLVWGVVEASVRVWAPD